MAKIEIEANPDQVYLQELGVFDWPIWGKEISIFPWTYDCKEVCYLLEGKAIVTPEGGNPVTITSGNLVVFPPGMSCTWDIRAPLKKHYQFE